MQTFIREKIIAGLHGKEVLSIYKDFYKKMISESRKAPINIFTTNYDLYNEQALDFLGFPYNNGFTGTYKRKFNPASYKYYIKFMGQFLGIKIREIFLKKIMRILKMMKL